MAVNNIKLSFPDKDLKPLGDIESKALYRQAPNAQKKIRKTIDIDKISKLTNVPSDLIWAIVLVPTNGNNFAQYSNSGGICNLNYNVIQMALANEIKQGRLSKAEMDWLSPRVKNILSFPSFNLLDDNLNVFLGAIYLGQLLDKYKDNNSLKIFYVSQNPLASANKYYSNLMAQGGMMKLILDAI